MALSPEANTEGVLRVAIYSNGAPLPDSVASHLMSVTVDQGLNSIPYARIVLEDGDMPTSSFPVSDGSHFKPGAAIRIEAGYGDSQQPIYSGVVARHGLKISGNNYARLVIECRDKAAAMTVGRHNANYVDKKDSDIIQSLMSAAGLSADVTATTEQHPEIVQYYCTDWDFALARAEANGMVVIVKDGAATVGPPNTAASPALTVTYGTDLREFEADVDARTQFTDAQAVSWDPGSQQVLVGSTAAPQALSGQGDLEGATLAQVLGVGTFRLQTAAPVVAADLKTWADAQQLKSGLARVRGRVKFQGNALAVVGGLIELVGVGAHFSGNAYVCSVHHELVRGDWVTEVEFGQSSRWLTQRDDVMAPSAAGWLPGVEGIQIGVVLKIDGDPLGQQRVQVSTPVMQATTDGVWARLGGFYASNGFGAFFYPEVGDEVLLAYLNNDPSAPVILGSVYSSNHVPPYAVEASNDTKAIVTRCKHRVIFDEAKKIITIITPATNQVVLSDEDKSISLLDQNGNKIEMTPSGISIYSPKDIKITAGAGITMQATNNIGITSSAGDITASALNINATAQIGLVAKGSATAELSAAGQTTVKGALVMIN